MLAPFLRRDPIDREWTFWTAYREGRIRFGHGVTLLVAGADVEDGPIATMAVFLVPLCVGITLLDFLRNRSGVFAERADWEGSSTQTGLVFCWSLLVFLLFRFWFCCWVALLTACSDVQDRAIAAVAFWICGSVTGCDVDGCCGDEGEDASQEEEGKGSVFHDGFGDDRVCFGKEMVGEVEEGGRRLKMERPKGGERRIKRKMEK